MCRLQPGPRCPTHSRQKVVSRIKQRQSVTDKLATLKPGSKTYQDLIRRRGDLDDQLLMDYNDLASSPTQWKSLGNELTALIEKNPKDPKVSSLARSIATGKLLHAERTRQNKLMPAINHDTASGEAKEAWATLGDARADMARYKVRMDMNGSDYDVWRKWQGRHHAAAQRAQLAAARFDVVTEDGPSGWRDANEKARSDAIERVAVEADFTTPTAPQTMENVINDYADSAEGKGPLIAPELAEHLGDHNPSPIVDSPSWAEQRAKTNAASEAKGPQTNGDQADETNSFRGKPSLADEYKRANGRGRAKTPPGYSARQARRKQRLMSGRQLWSAARRGQKKLESGQFTQALRPAENQGKNEDATAMLDPTGISFLLAAFSSGRR